MLFDRIFIKPVKDKKAIVEIAKKGEVNMHIVYCTKCKNRIYACEAVTINKEHYCKLCAENKIIELERKLAESLKDKE